MYYCFLIHLFLQMENYKIFYTECEIYFIGANSAALT